jgi:hypothetical protein
MQKRERGKGKNLVSQHAQSMSLVTHKLWLQTEQKEPEVMMRQRTMTGEQVKYTVDHHDKRTCHHGAPRAR